eukprot:scaffold75398_cov17-Tisochrysis_lutea.AAC.1
MCLRPQPDHPTPSGQHLVARLTQHVSALQMLSPRPGGGPADTIQSAPADDSSAHLVQQISMPFFVMRKFALTMAHTASGEEKPWHFAGVRRSWVATLNPCALWVFGPLLHGLLGQAQENGNGYAM